MHKSNERCVWTTCFETVFFFAVLTVFCFGGCDTNIDSSQDPDWQANNSEADIASDDGKSQSKDPKEDELLEGYERTGEASVSWRVTCMGDSKVGYSQVTEQELKSPTGERFILVELKDKTRVKRFKQKTNQSYSCRSLLDGEGKLIGFVSELDAGSGLLTTRGRVKGDRLRLETANRAETQIDSVAWQASYRGHGADELSLRETPLKPGETRTIEMLAPLVHQVMKVTWKAKDYADVVLPDGKTMKLLEIEETSALPAISIEGTRWVDEKGLVWMVSLPTLAQTTYRTTEANALADDGGAFDLGIASVVKAEFPAGVKDDPHGSKRVVYQAKLKRANPAKSFLQGTTQSIRQVDDRTIEVDVIAVRPNEPMEIEMRSDVPPVAGDIEPNALIQSKDSRVLALAKEVAPADPWKMAQAAEKLVFQRIKKKNFSQAIASAADVAEHLEGDCTEHAVLLAAICRAKGIPARVAIGLVHFEHGFGYHMWTEVWIGERWVPLDATLGRGGIGAAHLKVANSNLKGASPLASFLPVVPLLSQLELNVLSAE